MAKNFITNNEKQTSPVAGVYQKPFNYIEVGVFVIQSQVAAHPINLRLYQKWPVPVGNWMPNNATRKLSALAA